MRHIYLDGRAHPSPWTPTPAGHSVGRYEGNTLVVETTGFTPGGVPGGGVRTAETVLVERFEVVTGRPAAHDYLHVDRPQGLPEAP